jgi:hypothetical protein
MPRATNRRIGKKIDGIIVRGWLYRNSLAPLAEVDRNNVVVEQFVYATNGLVPSYIVKSDATYRVVTDDIGTPRRIIDIVTGEIAQSIDLDEFGNNISDSAPRFQPFGFSGGIYDPEPASCVWGAGIMIH